MKTAITSRLAALAVLAIFTLPAPATPSEEAAVMAVTQAACDAFRRGDVQALEALLAPEFTLVGPGAQVQSRAENLEEARRGEPRYEVFRNHGMTARVYGNAAVVHGITTVKGVSQGQPFDVDLRFTDTLIRTQGKWRLVASHATKIPRQ